MKLRISDVSKMTGLSASGIRFYEQVGMIAPRRQKNGKYREFNLNELNLLMACRNYQKYGFSLKSISDLVNTPDEEDIVEYLRMQNEMVKQEIAEKQLLTDYIKSQIKSIEFARDNPKTCIIQNNPAFYRVKLWQPGIKIEGCLPEKQIHEWLDKLPFVESCLLFDPTALLEQEGFIESDWGLSIEEESVKKINFLPETPGEYTPSRRCVYTTVESDDKMRIHSSKVEHVRQFIKKHRLHVTGPAIDRRIYNTRNDSLLRRFDHLWIPVEESRQ